MIWLVKLLVFKITFKKLLIKMSSSQLQNILTTNIQCWLKHKMNKTQIA